MTTQRGPFLTKQQAAQYCGYSVDYFHKLMKQHNLPLYGPKKNRIALSDLEKFMLNPRTFESSYKSEHKALVRMPEV